MKSFAILAFSLMLSFQASANEFYRTDDPLSRAYAADAAGDPLKMVRELKAALQQHPFDSEIRKNALSLFRRATERAGQAGLPADWKLPEDITKLVISVRRIESDKLRYGLRIFGNTRAPGLVSQLQVIRYPDQVVMDRENQVGKFEETQNAKGEPEFNSQSEKTREKVASGLYLLKIVLKSGQKVDGWFLIDDEMTSTASPIVKSPSVDEVIRTGTPTFKWVNFQSPAYKPYEVRSIWVGISRVDLGDEWVKKWELWQRSPSFEEITVGTTTPIAGEPVLENGKYILSVNYHERQNFGDIFIERDSITNRTFEIRK